MTCHVTYTHKGCSSEHSLVVVDGDELDVGHFTTVTCDQQ